MYIVPVFLDTFLKYVYVLCRSLCIYHYKKLYLPFGGVGGTG